MKPSRRNIKTIGTTLTGQIIDLSQFNKPKRKKEEPKSLQINRCSGSAANANKKSVKDCSKPGAPRP
jgi:translation initiation factor IF-2